MQAHMSTLNDDDAAGLLHVSESSLHFVNALGHGYASKCNLQECPRSSRAWQWSSEAGGAVAEEKSVAAPLPLPVTRCFGPPKQTMKPRSTGVQAEMVLSTLRTRPALLARAQGQLKVPGIGWEGVKLEPTYPST